MAAAMWVEVGLRSRDVRDWLRTHLQLDAYERINEPSWHVTRGVSAAVGGGAVCQE